MVFADNHDEQNNSKKKKEKNKNESSHNEKKSNEDEHKETREEEALGLEAGSVTSPEAAAGNREYDNDLVDALKKQVEEYKDKYLRAAAEMENMRRRIERERAEIVQYGLERFLSELLPVLDSFDLAISSKTVEPQTNETKPPQNDNTSTSSFYDGVLLVRKQLEAILNRIGLKVISSKDQPFDPNIHQAIQRIESEETDREIVKDEFVKGYFLKDRLLRPAIVSVLVPGSPKQKNE